MIVSIVCSPIIKSELTESDFELLKYTVFGIFAAVDMTKVNNLQSYLINIVNSNPSLRIGNLYYDIEFLNTTEEELTVVITTIDSVDLQVKTTGVQVSQLIH